LISQYTQPDWLSKFKYFKDEPIAAASVGQVHYGELNTGEKVAVKIIKPIKIEEFKSDIKRLKKFFRFISFFYPKIKKVFDPIGVLEYINEYTLQEVNLLNELEGRNILYDISQKFSKEYDFSFLAFHKVFPDFSNESVLVTEFIEGKSFDELMELGRLDYEWILRLFQIHGFYLFSQGVFHGDIHPGNIFLWNDKIYFVDTGAITSIDSKLRIGLFRFFEALSRYDYSQCVEFLNNMSQKKLNDKQLLKFKKKFFELYSDFENKTVGEVSLTKKMMNTIRLAVNMGMSFDKGMFSIIKSLMYMDGMVLRVNKNVNLMLNIRNFIEQLKPWIDEE